MSLLERVGAGPVQACGCLGDSSAWAVAAPWSCSCDGLVRCGRCAAGHVHEVTACECCGEPLDAERFPVHRVHTFDALTVEFSVCPGAVMRFEHVRVRETLVACLGCAAELASLFADTDF